MPARRFSVTTTAALAEHLKLSRTTISRALNGHPKVHPDTRAAIRAAMDSLGFAPSAPARSLRGARTRIIGVCFRHVGIPIHVLKLEAVCRTLRGAGWLPSVELIDPSPEMWRTAAAHFAALRTEGVIFIGTDRDAGELACVDLLARRDIPAVFLDPLEHSPTNTVSLDRRAAMQHIVAHLAENQHPYLGLVGIATTGPTAQLRRAALMAAMRRHGFGTTPPPAFPAPAVDPTCVERILATTPRPTALVAMNDRVALHVLHDLRRRGARVPEDFAIVGFDNLPEGATSFPSLTTIDQDVGELARQALLLLEARLANGANADLPSRLVAPRLLVRESTAVRRS
jgi:DNA-binding LacI/PurR family transcriptional regulator